MGHEALTLFVPSIRKVASLGLLPCEEINRLARELSDMWFQSSVSAIQACPLEHIFADLKQEGLFPTCIPFDLLNFIIRLVTHAMADEPAEALQSLAAVCHSVWKDFLASYTSTPLSADLWHGVPTPIHTRSESWVVLCAQCCG